MNVLQEDVSPQDATPCEDRTAVNKTVLGGLLQQTGLFSKNELKLNDVSSASYVEFSFYNPVYIQGWAVHGRNGEMFGPLEKRRGYVGSYVVTVANDSDEGGMKTIRNPETDEEVRGSVLGSAAARTLYSKTILSFFLFFPFLYIQLLYHDRDPPPPPFFSIFWGVGGWRGLGGGWFVCLFVCLFCF